MKSIIKTLEAIGQNASIKQFNSFNDMKNGVGIDDNILSEIENKQLEFVCHQHTPDEDDK